VAAEQADEPIHTESDRPEQHTPPVTVIVAIHQPNYEVSCNASIRTLHMMPAARVPWLTNTLVPWSRVSAAVLPVRRHGADVGWSHGVLRSDGDSIRLLP